MFSSVKAQTVYMHIYGGLLSIYANLYMYVYINSKALVRKVKLRLSHNFCLVGRTQQDKSYGKDVA